MCKKGVLYKDKDAAHASVMSQTPAAILHLEREKHHRRAMTGNKKTFLPLLIVVPRQIRAPVDPLPLQGTAGPLGEGGWAAFLAST